MLRKYATLQVLEAWGVPARASGESLRKHAHRVAFDYDPRPGYLYVRSRMISSRTNDNHDTFPAGEIEKGYKTFLGKPVFVNHNNANHRRARGVIVAVALHRDRNPDRTPDTWVEGLMEVDALRFPKLAQAILAGKVNRTSMGVDVEESTCSACGNRATTPAEYCRHLPALKGKKIRKRNPRTGKVEEKLIHEVCAGLSFFENSLLVEDPADPTAVLLDEPDARGLKMAASKHTAAPAAPHPGRLQGGTCRETCTYGGTHCAVCHEPVLVNLHKPHVNGGWGHADGMKRDHPATPADPEGVMASIPAQQAAKDQARAYVSDLLERQGLPRRQPGDMPPDPFLARRRGRPMPAHQAAGPRYPNPGDHPWFQANPVSHENITAAYHGTTDDERSLGDRWYADAHHVAKAIAGGDAATGAGLLSAYSPQTAWPINMFNASRAAQGDPPGPGSGAMGMHQKPALRILAGEHHSQVLKAPKTAAFAHLIEHGDDTDDDAKNGTEKVVVDRHAMSVAAGRRLGKDEVSGAPLDHPHYYNHVAEQYRRAASTLSGHYGRKIAPHQVQAATWLRQIRMNQAEDASGERGGAGKGRVVNQQRGRERWKQHHQERHPGEIPEQNMHYHGQRKQAYGETRVPAQVDTLRMEECPVCGEHDVWSGDRCPVCGFIVPPSMFRDPDTSKAQQVRDELDQDGEVVEPGMPGDPSTGQIGSGEDADSQLLHPDQVAPDGVPTVQGSPGPGDAQDPAQEPGQGEQAGGEELEEQGEQDQEAGAEEEAEGQEMENEGEENQLAPEPQGGLVCPACGTSFAPDMAAQPGVPCPACQRAALQPAGGPQKEQEDDPSAEEDEDEREDMPGGKTAAALAQAQTARIASLAAENEVLREQLGFLARAAGADQHLEQIRANVMRRHADVLNPASPVPDPPEAPPSETTEMALAPDAMDDPSRPGTTPNSVEAVPAAQTTTSITPGVEIQTPPATNLVDVTAPVQGTNPSQDGGVPIQQRRIETDVRIDPDPLKAHGPGIGGAGNDGTAFPWMLDARGEGQQKAAARQAGEEAAAARTFGSIRLAKLRVQAGLAQGDELAVAETIEKDARMTGPMIEHEIATLSRLRPAAPRPMARQAQRAAPSLAPVGASYGHAAYAPAVADDLDGSDIFI